MKNDIANHFQYNPEGDQLEVPVKAPVVLPRQHVSIFHQHARKDRGVGTYVLSLANAHVRLGEIFLLRRVSHTPIPNYHRVHFPRFAFSNQTHFDQATHGWSGLLVSSPHVAEQASAQLSGELCSTTAHESHFL